MGINYYGVDGRTNNIKLKILKMVFRRDKNIPRVNMRVKGIMVRGDIEIIKELKNKLKVRRVGEVDKRKESERDEKVRDGEVSLLLSKGLDFVKPHVQYH